VSDTSVGLFTLQKEAHLTLIAGALFLLSSWYRRSELGFRGALLFSGSQIGSAFSGLIGAGIQGGMDGVRGLESWRWIFIIEYYEPFFFI
jgi:hypothetical protein